MISSPVANDARRGLARGKTSSCTEGGELSAAASAVAKRCCSMKGRKIACRRPPLLLLSSTSSMFCFPHC